MEAIVRIIAYLGLILMLAGCSDQPVDTVTTPPSPAAIETGGCHAWAQEREAEAGWTHLDADDAKRVSTAAYDDCQQWNTQHAWTGTP
jgi:hypothetical protein